jgi:hypothetical protein
MNETIDVSTSKTYFWRVNKLHFYNIINKILIQPTQMHFWSYGPPTKNLKHLYHILSRNILKMEKVHSSKMVVPTYQKHGVIKENLKKILPPEAKIKCPVYSAKLWDLNGSSLQYMFLDNSFSGCLVFSASQCAPNKETLGTKWPKWLWNNIFNAGTKNSYPLEWLNFCAKPSIRSN